MTNELMLKEFLAQNSRKISGFQIDACSCCVYLTGALNSTVASKFSQSGTQAFLSPGSDEPETLKFCSVRSEIERTVYGTRYGPNCLVSTAALDSKHQFESFFNSCMMQLASFRDKKNLPHAKPSIDNMHYNQFFLSYLALNHQHSCPVSLI